MSKHGVPAIHSAVPHKLVLYHGEQRTLAGWPEAHSDNAKLMHSCVNTRAGTCVHTLWTPL